MRHVGIVGKKLLRLLLGFFVLALASAVIKQANIGLGPWDALHDGISVQTPLTYGQASMAAGLVIVVIDFLCKERLGFGKLLNIFVIGALVDVILMSGLVPKLDGSLLPGCLYGLVGMVLMGVGIWLYISAGMGAGPRDSLMVILTRRTGVSVGICRAGVEGIALVLGWLLGGQIGVGTILFTLAGGPIMQLVFRIVKFDVKGIHHETFADTIRFLKQGFAGEQPSAEEAASHAGTAGSTH